MDASDIYYVARFLLAAARRVIVPEAEGRLSGTERLVLEDLVAAAPTTVTEISQRTQIAQSRVSTILSEWRQRGAVDVGTDPQDRRRTLLSPSDSLKERYQTGAIAGLDDVVDELGIALTPEERQSVGHALDLLHQRLRPDHC